MVAGLRASLVPEEDLVRQGRGEGGVWDCRVLRMRGGLHRARHRSEGVVVDTVLARVHHEAVELGLEGMTGGVGLIAAGRGDRAAVIATHPHIR